MKIKEKIYYLREYFFPSGCAFCGKDLFKGEDAFYGLCPGCRGFILSLVAGQEPLAVSQEKILETPLGKIKVISFFPYTGSFRAALGAYKFGGSLGLGNFFALSLAQGLDSLELPEGGAGEPDAAWVPVPPRPGKIKKQGWDQISFLSGLLKNYSPLPLNSCLKRLPSKTQKELNKKDREENLKGRIICIKKPPKTAILFDDVITTGATLKTCAQALLEGGAEKVYSLCLFYD